MRTLARMMAGLLLGAAIVAPAAAQDRGGRDGRAAMMNGDSRREAVARGRETMNPGVARGDNGGARAWGRGADRSPDRGADRAAARAGAGTRGGMTTGVTPGADTSAPGGQRWSTDRRDWNRDNGAAAAANAGTPNRNWTTDRQRWDGNGNRNGRDDAAGRGDAATHTDGDRRDGRDRRWAGNGDGRNDGRNWDRDRNDGRDWNRDRDRKDGRDWDRNDRRDHDRWNQNWRDDRRHAWRSYRDQHRTTYRLPRYVPPRWGYSYRRWDIGYRWDSWFYTSNYWISDPWQYRLPPAYGPYRWVRYYDDAVLVDTYTGEIVDIIYDFFF